LGCKVVLVDTFDKFGGGLLDVCSPPALARLVADAHALGMRVALAGGLMPETLKQLLPLRPEFIGVRGAACHDGRASALDGSRVRRLAACVRA
jgi:uncharacterized protein (UPF0264 family)